jgi:hypothetical protein
VSCERAPPERGVTVHSGHMGYTIGLFAGEQKWSPRLAV